MKAERLIELINHPDLMDNDELRELATLVSRYPYFQAARVLYLKALHISSGARFRNELKETSAYIPSHKQLYKYLHDQIEFETSDLTTEGKEDNLNERVEDRIREINGYISVNTHGIPVSRKEKPGTQSKEEEDEILNIDFPAPHPVSLKRPAEEKNVVSNPIILEGIPGLVGDYGDVVGQTSYTSYEVVEHKGSHKYVVEPVKPTHKEAFEPIVFTPMEQSAPEEEKQVAFELIHDEVEEPEVSVQGRTPAAIELIETNGAYHLEGEEEELSIDELVGELRKKPAKKKNDLINKFIIDEPTIPRGQLENVDNRDLSEDSNKESENLFSETLAKIYIRQKLYDKAVATYIKLSLKYPEKSVYFANRIEKINEKINNNE